jgi:hypothetical protein
MPFMIIILFETAKHFLYYSFVFSLTCFSKNNYNLAISLKMYVYLCKIILKKTNGRFFL